MQLLDIIILHSSFIKDYIIKHYNKRRRISFSNSKDGLRVLIAGDSLALPRPYNIYTFDPEKDEELAVHVHDTYGYMVQKELSKIYPKIDVINRAQRAHTIRDVYVQFFDHLFYFQPDIVILHTGIVDCWPRKELNGESKTNIRNFFEYYNEIVKLIKKRRHTKLIIIGICPTSKKMDKKYSGTLQRIDKYNQILMSGRDQQQIFFINMQKYIDIDRPNVYLLSDDQHLNRKGNKLVCSLICNLINKINLQV